MDATTVKRVDVRRLRKALGFTQLDLSWALGVTVSTVYLWERGGVMSKLGRQTLVAWLRQPAVLTALLAALGPDDLLAALGDLAVDVVG